MDQTAFDRIARLLGGGATRRTGLRALLGAMVGLPALGAAAGRPTIAPSLSLIHI